MRCATAFGVMLIAAGLGRAGEKVVDHWITETTLFRGIAIPASEYSHARIQRLVEKLFRAASKRKLVFLSVVPETPDSNRAAVLSTEIDPFKMWRAQYDWMVGYTGPIAEATLIGGEAVLRYRDSRGRETRTILAGTDPRLFHRDGVEYEIVGIHREGLETRPSITLLIRTDAPIDEGAAARLTEEYRGLLGVSDLALVFRTDCWFVSEWFYPTFKGCGAPPSEAEFRKTSSWRCISSGGPQVTCVR